MKKFLLYILILNLNFFNSFSEERFLVFNECFKKTYDTYGKLLSKEDFYKEREVNQKLFEKLTDVVLRVDLQTNDVRIIQKSPNDLNPGIFFGEIIDINKNFLIAEHKIQKDRRIAYDFKQNTIIFIYQNVQAPKEDWWYCKPFSGSNSSSGSSLKSILKMLN